MMQPVELLRREFTVDVPLEQAWQHLARVEEWPSWARHIKGVTLTPPGPLTARSAGALRLQGGLRSTFVMSTFDPPERWTWIGSLLWLKVHYDHAFTPLDDGRTRLTWTVAGTGAGTSTLGRVFAAVYRRNLDRAIPNLQAELRRT